MASRFFKRAAPAIRPGYVSPQRTFDSLPRAVQDRAPPYAPTGMVPPALPRVHLNSDDEIASMRLACRAAAQILQVAGEACVLGNTTAQIDDAVYDATVGRGHYPSPLNYHGFPKTVCTSVNEVICHGIPDDRALADGDIINCDVSAYVEGHHGDNSAMFLVGDVSEEGRRLVDATRDALAAAIEVCRPGRPLTSIGDAIAEVYEPLGYESVQQYCGHGVGADFHMLPFIHHYRNDIPGTMEERMIFTIEPMLVAGKQASDIWSDGWTVVAADGSLSAQFEHTILITKDGAEILTLP